MNTPTPIDRLLREVHRLSQPAVDLRQVADWVRRGRPRAQTYWRVWLRRVWHWPLS